MLVLERLPYSYVLIAMLIDSFSPRPQLLSVTPLVKREVLVKVPVVSSATYRTKSHLTSRFKLGSYYEDKTPTSDKPF